MDISVGKDGVWCDVCRTFFVLDVTKEQRELFELIKKTVRVGHSALKVGARACDVYNAVNSEYQKSGYTLVHHAGHKIGEEPLMQPQFLADNQTEIECGTTYTIESGLYTTCGIRLENNYLVKNEGAEDLFEQLLPLDIEEYILK
jgi:Xaa-Pro dipeptidase